MKQAHKYFLLISGAILLLLGVLWYNHNVNNSEPPLIKADLSPKRIKPENAGNTIVENDDNIYDRMKSQPDSIKNANLVPEPETPINISSLQKTAPQEDAIDSIISGIEDEEAKRAASEAINEEVPNQKSLNIVTIADDKTDATTPHHKHAKKEYYIQIASTRTKVQAGNEWNRISQAQSKILSDVGHKVVKYEIGTNGIFYQLLAGPFKTSSHTKLICKKLVNAKQNCVIKKL